MNNSELSYADLIDVIEEILGSGGEVKIYPKGTSMLPLIVQGRDNVILTRREYAAKKHDVAFYRRDNGQFVLHRVMKKRADGTFTMCGDNQRALEKGIRADQIIGVMSQIERKGKLISVESFRYRAYVFFWTKMPIRSCFFLLRKIRRVFGKSDKKS